jgi:molybdopterin molybdotransferase
VTALTAMAAHEQGRAGAGSSCHGVPWPEARRLASGATALPRRTAPLTEASGLVLAADVVAVNDLPAADNSAMDGWAVAGAPPWRVVAALAAGSMPSRPLAAGECARIATGAAVPEGTSRVLPVEDSVCTAGTLAPAPWSDDAPSRTHIRRRGEEARSGDHLLRAGSVVTPPVIGLAAAAGNDVLAVVPAPTVRVLVLGDELTDSGAADGRHVRDALGPQLPGWLAALGARPSPVRRLPDDLTTLVDAVRADNAEVLVTTGGTGPGRRNHVRRAIGQLGGTVLVDGVDVKPGRHMLLGRLPDGRWLVGLPGNPFAACAALVTLVQPLLAGLAGRAEPPTSWTRLATAEPRRPGDGHRLVPVLVGAGGVAAAQPSCGPAMLRGLALASGLAVVPPDGAGAGDVVPYLPLPWGAAAPGPVAVDEPADDDDRTAR